MPPSGTAAKALMQPDSKEEPSTTNSGEGDCASSAVLNNNNNNNTITTTTNNNNNNNSMENDVMTSSKRPRSFEDSPSETSTTMDFDKDNSNRSVSKLLQTVEDTLRHEMPAGETADYWEAMNRDPVLVERESNVATYLRYAKNDVKQTATKLANYWKQRVELFGARAFLPLLDVSGKGALDDSDVECLKTAWIISLPNDSAGRSVLCLDKSKLTFGREGGAYTKRLRCWFFWIQIAGMKSETGELCVIRVTQDLSIDKEGLQRVIDFMENSFPLRSAITHICCIVTDTSAHTAATATATATATSLPPEAKPNKKDIFTRLAAPITVSKYKKVLHEEHVVETHIAASTTEMIHKLLATGQFENAESLPIQIGGTFGDHKFHAWFNHRLEFGFAYAWKSQTANAAASTTSTSTSTRANWKSLLALLSQSTSPRLQQNQKTAANRVAERKKLKGKLEAAFSRIRRNRNTHQDSNAATATTTIHGGAKQNTLQ